MDKKHIGANSELIACSYYLDKGYEVFRNVSAHGPADIIAWNPETNETLKIDVKTASAYTKKDNTLSFAFSAPLSEFVEVAVVYDGKVIKDAERALEDDLERIKVVK